MRIVYLHQYFTTPSMHGGTRSYEMARRLVAAGHEVHMVTTDRGGEKSFSGWNVTQESGIYVHWYKVPYSNTMGFYSRIKAFIQYAVVSAIRAVQLKADVVYATSTPLTIAIPGVWTSWRCRIPLVFEVRDVWPELPIAVGELKNPIYIFLAKWLEKFAYRNSARIVALSSGMKESIVAKDYPADKITVIPNSCDLELFNIDTEKPKEFRAKYEWLKDRPYVLYCGALGLINGVHYMADLAAEMMKIDPEVRFIAIGEGRMEDYIRKRAKQHGVLNQNFFMLPPVPKKEIPAVLKASDISTSFIIDVKAIWNNSANKFFDSLAAGVPIAINHEGWQAELLRATGAGLVLEPTATPDCAKKLYSALKDTGWKEKAKAAALKLAKEEFSRDILAGRLEKVLSTATEKN